MSYREVIKLIKKLLLGKLERKTNSISLSLKLFVMIVRNNYFKPFNERFSTVVRYFGERHKLLWSERRDITQIETVYDFIGISLTQIRYFSGNE